MRNSDRPLESDKSIRETGSGRTNWLKVLETGATARKGLSVREIGSKQPETDSIQVAEWHCEMGRFKFDDPVPVLFGGFQCLILNEGNHFMQPPCRRLKKLPVQFFMDVITDYMWYTCSIWLIIPNCIFQDCRSVLFGPSNFFASQPLRSFGW